MFQPARSLFVLLDPRARRRVMLGVVFTTLSAFAELATIGMAIPFIALLLPLETGGTGGVASHVTRLGRWGSWLGDMGLGGVAVLLVSAVLVAACMRLVLAWSMQRIVAAIGHDLSVRLWHRMLHQPYAHHARRNSSMVLGGLEKVRPAVAGVIQPAMQGMAAGIVAIVIAVLLCAIQPLAAGIVATSIAAIYLAVSLLIRARLRSHSTMSAAAIDARTRLVQEGLGGIRDIILGRLQPVFEERFRRIDVVHRDAMLATSLTTVAPRLFAEAAAIAGVVVVAVVVGQTPGGIVTALPLLGAMALGGQRLLPLVQQTFYGWSQATSNVQMLIDVLHLIDSDTDDRVPDAPALAWRQLRFDDVFFTHGEGRTTLARVDLAIARGDRIGIMGRTGSGKSTLLDLVMGLVAPTHGVVLVDDRPLDRSLRAGWWAGLAHVPQSVYLADDTIAGNIAFGSGVPVDSLRLAIAARAAGVEAIVKTLPEGYATSIGERGIRLSGGQRQRIGIARALYRTPSLLILDEATNALDVATEEAVMQAIAALDPDMTIVVVAHRQSSLAICTRVLQIEDGGLHVGC